MKREWNPNIHEIWKIFLSFLNESIDLLVLFRNYVIPVNSVAVVVFFLFVVVVVDFSS